MVKLYWGWMMSSRPRCTAPPCLVAVGLFNSGDSDPFFSRRRRSLILPRLPSRVLAPRDCDPRRMFLPTFAYVSSRSHDPRSLRLVFSDRSAKPCLWPGDHHWHRFRLTPWLRGQNLLDSSRNLIEFIFVLLFFRDDTIFSKNLLWWLL